MMSSWYMLMVVSLWSCLCGVFVSTSTNKTCPDSPVFIPSRLVVKFGEPFSATCQVCQYDCNSDSPLGLEIPIGNKVPNGTNIQWTVDKTDVWTMKPQCYYENNDGDQCSTSMNVTVYQPPVNVSVRFVNHNGPMLAGQQYTLQCTVQDVAPAENLTVTLYRGHTALGQQHSDRTQKEPVTEVFTWTINATEGDGEADYRCEAKLELGSVEPLTVSENLTTTVYYEPQVSTKPTSVITVTKGKLLNLDCSAKGNPVPSYTWTGPLQSGASSYNQGVFSIKTVNFDHKGDYICNVTNSVGTDTVIFRVEVEDDPFIMYIIIAVVLAVGVIIAVITGVLSYNKRYKMGQYNLKDVLFTRKQHVAVPIDG